MAKTIQIVQPNGSRMFVSFIQRGKIHCTQAYDCKLRAIPDEQADAMLVQVSSMVPAAWQLSILDFNEVKQTALREHPVCSVIEHTTTANRLNLQPWHHLHFQGGYVFAIVWDTRRLEAIIPIEQLVEEDFANLRFVYNDNYMPVAIPADAPANAEAIWQSTFRLPSTMTDEQYSLIKGRK